MLPRRRGVIVKLWIFGLWLLAATHSDIALAEPAPQLAAPSRRIPPRPSVRLQRIELIGNTFTNAELILRVIPLEPGQVLAVGDGRLRQVKLKVLSLGFFRDVIVRLKKGEEVGQVILQVTVIERGTWELNRIFLGRSEYSQGWGGLDLTERNLWGSGIALGLAGIYAAGGEKNQRQVAGEIRLSSPTLLRAPFGWRGQFRYADSDSPLGTGGDQRVVSKEWRGAFWLTHRLLPTLELSTGVGVGGLSRGASSAPCDCLPESENQLFTVRFGLDFDNRSNPILPQSGTRAFLYGQTSVPEVGDYRFVAMSGGITRHVRIAEGQTLSLQLGGVTTLGNAPLSDIPHAGDVNRMVTPRALGLILSQRASFDLLGGSTERRLFGDFAGVASVEYALSWFRRDGQIFGGDLYVGAGFWGLANTQEFFSEFEGGVPIDALLDLGVRLDTELGVFELGIANALGRLPL